MGELLLCIAGIVGGLVLVRQADAAGAAVQRAFLRRLMRRRGVAYVDRIMDAAPRTREFRRAWDTVRAEAAPAAEAPATLTAPEVG